MKLLALLFLFSVLGPVAAAQAVRDEDDWGDQKPSAADIQEFGDTDKEKEPLHPVRRPALMETAEELKGQLREMQRLEREEQARCALPNKDSEACHACTKSGRAYNSCMSEQNENAAVVNAKTPAKSGSDRREEIHRRLKNHSAE